MNLIDALALPETAYIFSAGACIMSGLRTMGRSARHALIESVFWLGMSLILMALTIFNLEDLQGVLANEGRQIAREGGWYRDRREVLASIIQVLVIGTGAVVVLVLLLLGDLRSRLGLAILAAGGLLGFVAVRALSLHQIDALLYRRGTLGASWNDLFESGLVLMVGLTAVLAVWTVSPPPATPIRVTRA
jgi:hypothetical protein